MPQVSIDVIARESGVSASTVSRVFNRRPYVKDVLRHRVLLVAQRLGYNPPVMVRRTTISIVSGSSDVGNNSYEASMLGSFFSAASQIGFNVELVSLRDLEQVYLNFSQAVIAMIYNEKSADCLRRLVGVPVVTINYQTKCCHYVCTDHFGGAYQGTEHLLAHGHRCIGVLLAPYADNMSWGEEARLAGCRQALAAHHLELPPERILYGTLPQLSQVSEMVRISAPSALLVCGENLLLPVYHQLVTSGFRIPEDISLVSYFNSSVTPYLLPEPTCLVQDLARLSRLTMESIRNLLTEDGAKIELMLDNGFIDGKSVRHLVD
ncbi:MAG: LacI family DNA-binding transcriptional regulator [Lentisphaeria bacterium]